MNMGGGWGRRKGAELRAMDATVFSSEGRSRGVGCGDRGRRCYCVKVKQPRDIFRTMKRRRRRRGRSGGGRRRRRRRVIDMCTLSAATVKKHALSPQAAHTAHTSALKRMAMCGFGTMGSDSGLVVRMIVKASFKRRHKGNEES